MNYRHAYHAGNFADVIKHLILARVLTYFMRKETPFFVMDTHAGVGKYDLSATEANKTQEYERGVVKFLNAVAHAPKPIRELCEPYVALLAKLNPDQLKVYPGSPLIAQSMIRRTDRLSLIELHPDDYAKSGRQL
ncbi:MAG: 23S rRNA (adenine(2030)-N(6))-methyltransferase RlmJ [Ahrensia sp.]|nr:23S rRNA (adenine(2030)-N(6))-methyltransferase RlmJ [Ahrensia sp.]